MANIINKSYFFGDLNIGQLNQLYVQDALEDAINVYEAEYLKKAFGKTFYDFIINNQSNPAYSDLMDLLKKERSPIACYVFYHYQRQIAYQASGVGDVRPKVENATRTNETYRMVIAWNIMVERSLEIYLLITRDSKYKSHVDRLEIDRDIYRKINYFDI